MTAAEARDDEQSPLEHLDPIQGTAQRTVEERFRSSPTQAVQRLAEVCAVWNAQLQAFR